MAKRKETAMAIVKALAKLTPHDDSWGMKDVVSYKLPKLQDRARRFLKTQRVK